MHVDRHEVRKIRREIRLGLALYAQKKGIGGNAHQCDHRLRMVGEAGLSTRDTSILPVILETLQHGAFEVCF